MNFDYIMITNKMQNDKETYTDMLDENILESYIDMDNPNPDNFKIQISIKMLIIYIFIYFF
jgi:hypothetical protein